VTSKGLSHAVSKDSWFRQLEPFTSSVAALYLSVLCPCLNLQPW